MNYKISKISGFINTFFTTLCVWLIVRFVIKCSSHARNGWLVEIAQKDKGPFVYIYRFRFSISHEKKINIIETFGKNNGIKIIKLLRVCAWTLRNQKRGGFTQMLLSIFIINYWGFVVGLSQIFRFTIQE